MPGNDLSDHWQHREDAGPDVVATTAQGVGVKPGYGGYPLYQLVHLDLVQLRQQNVLAAAGRLATDGGNLANAFATLPRPKQAAVAVELCRLTSVFADVGTVPTGGGRHWLRFQDRWSDAWYTPDEVSDGTILLLAYLLLQHQTPPVDVIAIEEPDRGLHPYLMGQLVTLLRAMSEGKIGGRPVQILLATHSPELLDHLRPEEVRFVSRDRNDGAVQVTGIAPNDPQWEAAFKEYRESLGSVWLAGGLGGVPGE